MHTSRVSCRAKLTRECSSGCVLGQGHDEAHEGSKLNAFIDGCMDVSPKRAGSAELHVTSGDMRRFKATVQLYPLGTMEGALTHFLLVMEEVPVCASLSQTSGFPMFAPCPIMQS